MIITIQFDTIKKEDLDLYNKVHALINNDCIDDAFDDADVSTFDITGLPHDRRIHADSLKKNSDGTWRRRRGVSDDYFDDVVKTLHREKPVDNPPFPELLPPAEIAQQFGHHGSSEVIDPLPAPPPPPQHVPIAPNDDPEIGTEFVNFTQMMLHIAKLMPHQITMPKLIELSNALGLSEITQFQQQSHLIPTFMTMVNQHVANNGQN